MSCFSVIRRKKGFIKKLHDLNILDKEILSRWRGGMLNLPISVCVCMCMCEEGGHGICQLVCLIRCYILLTMSGVRDRVQTKMQSFLANKYISHKKLDI